MIGTQKAEKNLEFEQDTALCSMYEDGRNRGEAIRTYAQNKQCQHMIYSEYLSLVSIKLLKARASLL